MIPDPCLRIQFCIAGSLAFKAAHFKTSTRSRAIFVVLAASHGLIKPDTRNQIQFFLFLDAQHNGLHQLLWNRSLNFFARFKRRHGSLPAASPTPIAVFNNRKSVHKNTRCANPECCQSTFTSMDSPYRQIVGQVTAGSTVSQHQQFFFGKQNRTLQNC